jgi:hypothetical protein
MRTGDPSKNSKKLCENRCSEKKPRRNYMRTEAPKKNQKKNMSEEMLRKKYPEKTI